MNTLRHHARRHPGGQRGLLLVECLVYISLWLTVLGLGFSCFYRVMTHSKHLARCSDDIVRVLKSGERWREDVRSATAVPRWEVLGPNAELTLRHGEEVVVYQITPTNVWRRSPAHPAGEELLRGLQSSRMVRDDVGPVRAWRWELELQSRAERPVLRPLFTFQAVNTAPPAP